MIIDRQTVIAWIALLAAGLWIGFGLGWYFGPASHAHDSTPCVTAVRLLDTKDLLGPANAGTREQYLKAHDACIKENPRDGSRAETG